MKNNQTGFVFIELMYVVAIIGILAAIAVPSYQNYTERAKIVEPLVSTSEVRTAVNEFFRATGRYPSNNEEAGLAPANAYRGNFFISTSVEKGAIHVELDPLITERTNAKWLSLRPIANPLALTDLRWSCGYGSANETEKLIGTNKTDIPTQYLPNNCR